MKKRISLVMIGFWLLPLALPPDYSRGAEPRGETETVSSGKSTAGKLKDKAGKEVGEIKKGAKDTARDMKESTGEARKKAGEKFQETGKALKESGREMKKNVGESWENLKKVLSK